MKIKNIITALAALFLLVNASFSQDKRLLETKVADLLAQFPVNDLQANNKLMVDMLGLGEQGFKSICDKIIPLGTGDDTKARFAIESFTRYLSASGMQRDRNVWENICISYATGQKDPGVKDFFIKQLQLIGGDATIEALKGFLTDQQNCFPAVSAITAAGGKKAEQVLAEALRDPKLPCAAAVMNALAGMNSSLAVNEYITWSADINVNTKSAAYNALARSGSPAAYPVLLKAAQALSFRWDRTNATGALLTYAQNAGANGDIKTMDKICKLLIAKCNDKLNIQNKTAALDIYAGFHGAEAMPVILKAAAHPDLKYRNAAINMTLKMQGTDIVQKWLNYFPKAVPAAKPEIIAMFGERGDELALPLVTESLNDPDPAVRSAAVDAISRLKGKEAAGDLVTFISKYDGISDQESASEAFMWIAGSNEVSLLRPLLKDGTPAARKTAIEIMAWNKGHQYFNEILPFASAPEEAIKAAAFKALVSLAGTGDQQALISLLVKTDNEAYISDLQLALASAANKEADPEKRSVVILAAMKDQTATIKLIPVLAKTGGREALATVLKEFENGDAPMREACFKALTTWTDYTASSALYEICATKNKTYEGPAFSGYVRQVRNANITDEQKLLLFRKIMPYAGSPDRQNTILTEVGKLKTYIALFFVGEYLNDPATAATAAKSAMYIALPSVDQKAGMYGTKVREILTKAITESKGQESDYDKEMIRKYLDTMPAEEGFVSMFNGKDLSGWQGLVENPVARAKMKPAELAKKQAEANLRVPGNWSVKDGCIWFNGKGDNLCSIKEYGDFEMLVDWKITREGDSGIYLRGTPQVQIWDTSRVSVGAQVGSGGLYNNQKNPSKPLKVVDNLVGEWNTFRIIMIGEKVSVWLNGELVVDNVTMENYWDRNIPIFPKGAIELQAHGTDLAFRDIYVREISEKEYNLTPEEKSEGFASLFNGRNLDNWVGNKQSYVVEDGMIVIKPENGSGGNLYTEKEYADFIFRFEFQLTPGANNGLGIRAPLTGDAAYVGMELQILDNTAAVYANLQPYQYHGSVYGVIPAKREFLKPVGEWNSEEVYIKGTQIRITLNGTEIVNGDVAGPRDNGTMDHNDHPGLKNATGHIGFLGHGSVVKFRNIRIKELN